MKTNVMANPIATTLLYDNYNYFGFISYNSLKLTHQHFEPVNAEIENGKSIKKVL